MTFLKPYLLVFDLGTTGIKALLINTSGAVVGLERCAVESIYPQPGWVEQNPQALWKNAMALVDSLLRHAKASWSEIHAIGITNQRETVVAWDKDTNEPLYNAIVWQCRRTQDACQALNQSTHRETILQKTGLLIDPYFSASKWQWLLSNVPEIQEAQKYNRLRTSTIDTWLINQLTQGQTYVTEPTNAARTQVYNIHQRVWDDELLSIFGLEGLSLPTVISNNTWLGETHPRVTGGVSIPITGVMGDQQAALFGHRCWQPGSVKCTFGTGAFWVAQCGSTPIEPGPLLLTLACNDQRETVYALEGPIFSAGSAIEWLKNQLGLAADDTSLNQLALSVSDSAGVYCVPAMTGLAAPYWQSQARGMITGLTPGANKAHITRAMFEAIAYQARAVMEAAEPVIQPLLSGRLSENKQGQTIRIDGGVSRSSFLVQNLADTLAMPVIRSDDPHLTARGVAYLAGLNSGFWPTAQTIEALPDPVEAFYPQMGDSRRAAGWIGWERAIQQCLSG